MFSLRNVPLDMGQIDRRWRIIGGGLIGGVVILLLIVAMFPWGVFRGIVEREATERFGRPVTIGAVERVDTFGFVPVIAIRDVRVPQADWAGTGDFARVKQVTVSFPVLPLLTGEFRPRDVTADGVRLVLVRDAQKRTNWDRPGKPQGGGGSTDLGAITIRDAIVSYADAVQDRRATMRLTADPDAGLKAEGDGVIRGAPVRIAVNGPAPVRGQPWPFTADITGHALTMHAKGSMDRPLDTDAMTLDVSARATDLKLIDAVIEAGLFRTRPVALTAHVRHDPTRWTITGLKGTIGRSDLRGRMTVDKIDGRSKIDGELISREFAFDDLTSPEGRAEGAAKERAIGPRLVPDTRIDIGNIDNTDGRLVFRVGQIVGPGANAPISSLAGTMTMDHQLLTLAPLKMQLAQGRVTGRATIDQRGDRRSPTLSFDIRLDGGRVAGFAAGGQFTGKVDGRARLSGTGDTIRSAIGRSSGSIGFVVRDGQLPQRYAAALGFDAGRALMAGSDDRAGLRCLIARVSVKGGRGRVDPLVVDTAISQLQGSGMIVFPIETLALTMNGAPKQDVILRIPGNASIGGTLTDPRIVVPREVKSVGNILKAIGNRITGHSGPVAGNADCDALAARALR